MSWNFNYHHLSSLKGYRSVMLPNVHYSPVLEYQLDEEYSLVKMPVDSILLYHKPGEEVVATIDSYSNDVVLYRTFPSHRSRVKQWLVPYSTSLHYNVLIAKTPDGREYFATPESRIMAGNEATERAKSAIRNATAYVQTKLANVDIQPIATMADPTLNCIKCMRTPRIHIPFHIDREEIGPTLFIKLTGIPVDQIKLHHDDVLRDRMVNVCSGLLSDTTLGFYLWYDIPKADLTALKNLRGY